MCRQHLLRPDNSQGAFQHNRAGATAHETPNTDRPGTSRPERTAVGQHRITLPGTKPRRPDSRPTPAPARLRSADAATDRAPFPVSHCRNDSPQFPSGYRGPTLQGDPPQIYNRYSLQTRVANTLLSTSAALQFPLGRCCFPRERFSLFGLADRKGARDALSLYTSHSSGRFSIAGTPP